jgi:DNA-binding NarL/FixJ family response regulator
MSKHRVFILWTHPLFSETVGRLLGGAEVEIIGSSSDPAAGLEEISRMQPDVVIAEEDPSGAPTEAIEALRAGPAEMLILGLNLANNGLQIYRREQRTVADPEDLLQILRKP